MLERTSTQRIVVPSHLLGQDIPSRLDLGKDKYGGPFSEEEVENMKATLRLIPIIFICSMVGAALQPTNLQLDQMTINHNSILHVFLVTKLDYFLR